MNIRHLDHLNMTVNNLEESIQWYRHVFDFQIAERGVRNGTPWAIIRSGEALLCLYEDAARTLPQQFLRNGGDRHTIYHFGLRITDRNAWLEKVEEHQLELEYGGEIDYPHSKSWYVFDPTGYGIEVALWENDTIQFDQPERQALQARAG